jgi:hypothetical protein
LTLALQLDDCVANSGELSIELADQLSLVDDGALGES